MSFILHVLLATALGSLIGLERQWRQRFAGLRTNALVATGAAAFAAAAVSPACAMNPGSIIGSIVSGIGFLGAGVIFKEDFSVSGLNTAATLWCSAAVGVLAGMGMLAASLALAAVIIGINVVLRPLARHLAQAPADAASEMESTYRVYGLCVRAAEQRFRAGLIQEAASAKLRVRDVHSESTGRGLVRISADLVIPGRDDKRLAGLTANLGLIKGVRAAHWQLEHRASHFE
jgi:putative Mg2+ transporter-C (MgtC) family protein